MLTPGQRLGAWVIDDSVSLADPILLRAHHADDQRRAFVEIHRRSPEAETQHRRRVAALGACDHPAIPKLLDHGIDDQRGLVWVATTPYDGDTLADHLISGPMDWRDACIVFRRVADALAHLHGRGLVHRDLTPQNIRAASDWTVYVVGFGVTMAASELEDAADPPLGNLSYLAPEAIADPNHHAARADLYALGCTLYEALHGKNPFPASVFDGQNAELRFLEWKTRSDALDPGDAAPAWLANLVRKATDPDPDKRLPDIDAFIGWLDAAQASWERPKNRMTPSPVARVQAPPPTVMPSLALVQPTLHPPTPPPARRHATPPPSGPPVLLAYTAAAALGMVTAFAFSALIILYVEALTG